MRKEHVYYIGSHVHLESLKKKLIPVIQKHE